MCLKNKEPKQRTVKNISPPAECCLWPNVRNISIGSQDLQVNFLGNATSIWSLMPPSGGHKIKQESSELCLESNANQICKLVHRRATSRKTKQNNVSRTSLKTRYLARSFCGLSHAGKIPCIYGFILIMTFDRFSSA